MPLCETSAILLDPGGVVGEDDVTDRKRKSGGIVSQTVDVDIDCKKVFPKAASHVLGLKEHDVRLIIIVGEGFSEEIVVGIERLRFRQTLRFADEQMVLPHTATEIDRFPETGSDGVAAVSTGCFECMGFLIEPFSFWNQSEIFQLLFAWEKWDLGIMKVFVDEFLQVIVGRFERRSGVAVVACLGYWLMVDS